MQIYDATLSGLVDILTESGIGHGKVMPWDGLTLSQAQLSDWGNNELNVESCTQIVNIISAQDRRYSTGMTTWDKQAEKPKWVVVR